MSEEKKKKGLLGRLFGRKTKEDKLAEAAAEKAARAEQVDAEMAARMAAINAAALKSAREQDEQAGGKVADADEIARIEAAEKARAEAQALEDVERAKQLAIEKKEKAAQAEREAAEEAARLEAERKAAEDAAKAKAKEDAERAEKARIAAEDTAAAEAKAKAEKAAAEEAALEKARKEQSAAEVEALKAKQAAAREKAEREEADRKAREDAEAKAEADKREAEKIAAEKEVALQAEQERLDAEKKDAEKREAEKKEAEDRAKAEALAKDTPPAASPEPDVSQDREPEPEPELKAAPKGGFLSRITRGLKKSTSRMTETMATVFKKRKLDDEAIEELQDLLIASDLGVSPAMKVTDRLARDKFDKDVTDLEIKIALADVISEILTPLEKPLTLTGAKLEIMLFVGVNGSGKTTTLGKLAKRYTDQGKSVMLCAGDTFRAAAVQQLTIWGERSGAPVVAGKPGADAAGLVYDAIERAKSEGIDILMIDTAGRLQNRTELMDELAKVVRVIRKQDETAPHHSILVLDATVGQNALSQTEVFRDTAGVTGLVMTKLDGTAKGGVLVALSDKFQLPIHAIGIGERIEDLENFSAPVFAAALSGVADAVTDES